MDISDIASDREQKDRDRALNAARSSHAMPITGICYWCKGETTGLFCCPECRDDWQRLHDAKTRNGR